MPREKKAPTPPARAYTYVGPACGRLLLPGRSKPIERPAELSDEQVKTLIEQTPVVARYYQIEQEEEE